LFAAVVFLAAAIAGTPADAQNGTITVPAGSGPNVVAVNPVTNKVYVANQGSDNVTVIDGVTNATTTVTTGSIPIAIAANPVTNKIYVANVGSNNVTVIDGATNETATVPAGTLPWAVAVNQVTNQIYVPNEFSNNVTVIDGATNATTTVPAGFYAFAVAVNPVTNKIYVANEYGNSVTVIDGATNATVTVPAGGTPYAVAVNPVTNQVYVANQGSNNVTVIDGATNAFTAVAAGSGPYDIQVNPVTNRVYVANSTDGTVTVIDGATNATTTVVAGSGPDAVAVNPVTNQVYVANSGSNNVTVIDGATNATATVVAGGNPAAIAVNPVTNQAYAANQDSNDVTVIDGAGGAGTPPTLSLQPSSQTMASGSTVVFNALAENQGGGPVSYQWFRNNVAVSGAIDSTYVISNATSANDGSYACRATNPAGAVVSNPATLDVVSSADPGRLFDISCRAQVGTGGNQLIVGYVVGGKNTSGAEAMLIRASGPALVPFGVTGVLPDPQLQLNNSSGVFATNNAWGGGAQIAAAAAAVGAFAWTDASSHDSALLESLPGGSYTAEISGAGGDTGVALAEVYDATPAASYTPASPRLVNISARARVGTGSGVLIVGFVIGGSTSKTMLVRVSGPALVPFGVTGVLPDPQLQLNNSSGVLATNNGWAGDAQIASAAASVGAFSWSDPNSHDSALLFTLPPGPYTALVSGASGDTGVSLVEVYEVP
jgi:YVTN family beta-propeller protein